MKELFSTFSLQPPLSTVHLAIEKALRALFNIFLFDKDQFAHNFGFCLKYITFLYNTSFSTFIYFGHDFCDCFKLNSLRFVPFDLDEEKKLRQTAPVYFEFYSKQLQKYVLAIPTNQI